jgi:hypothetical protein
LVDIAIVGGISYQRNTLVKYHMDRLNSREELVDSAGMLIMRRDTCGVSACAKLVNYEVSYRKHDPFSNPILDHKEVFNGSPCSSLGSSSLPVVLSTITDDILSHVLHTRDGVVASSQWEIF